MKLFSTRLALVLTIGLLGLPAVPTYCAPDTASTLRTIRAHYASVNYNLGHCIQVKRQIFGRSAEGGGLTGYRSGPSFCKITAIYYGETGRAAEEYYFWHGELFFVVESRMSYRQPLGAPVFNHPAGTVARTVRERFYLDHGKLILWIGGNNLPQALEGQTARERLGQLGKDVHEYLTLLHSPAAKA